MATPQAWRQVHAAGDAKRERVRRIVLRLLRAPVPSLETALASGKLSDVVTAYRRDTRIAVESATTDLSAVFLDILAAAGTATARFGIRRTIRGLRSAAMRTAEAVGISFSFNETSPDAIRWAEHNAAELVTAITDEQMIQLRLIVVDGFKNGKPPATLAKEIRQVVGLTDPQAGKFARILNEEGKSKAFAYADRAKRSRALTIARTEVLKAANEGQRQAWVQAKSAGLLTGQELREWITTADDRTCPVCLPMDGQLRGLNENFVLPTGAEVGGPPAHPRCRCAQGLSAQTRTQDRPTRERQEEPVAVPA